MAKKVVGRLSQAKEQKDARVMVLRSVVDYGQIARNRLTGLFESLAALEAYEATNRASGLDRLEEGEDTADTLRAKIEHAQSDILAADQAQAELQEIARFYRAYHIVVNGPKIKELKSRLRAAEYWAEQWKDRINNIGTDPDLDIDKEFAEKDYLEHEYTRAVEQIHQIQSQLRDIQNIRYM